MWSWSEENDDVYDDLDEGIDDDEDDAFWDLVETYYRRPNTFSDVVVFAVLPGVMLGFALGMIFWPLLGLLTTQI